MSALTRPCADLSSPSAAIIFFLWRHFTLLHNSDQFDDKQAIENEKKDLTKRLNEAKKAGADSLVIRQLQTELSRL